MRASYAQSTCFDITQFPPAQMHLLTKNASCHLHFYSADHYELWFHLSDCRQKYEHQLYWISKGYSQDGQIFKCHRHFSDNHDQLWVGHFTRKSSRLVIVDWHAIKVRVEMSHLVPSSTRYIDVVTLPLILSQQCTSMIIVNVSVTQTCPSVPPPPPRMLGHDWRPWSDCHSSLTVMDLPILWIVYRVYWWWQRSTAFVYGQRHIAKFVPWIKNTWRTGCGKPAICLDLDLWVLSDDRLSLVVKLEVTNRLVCSSSSGPYSQSERASPWLNLVPTASQSVPPHD